MSGGQPHLQRFFASSESAHERAVCVSVGAVLLALKARYYEDSEDPMDFAKKSKVDDVLAKTLDIPADTELHGLSRKRSHPSN